MNYYVSQLHNNHFIWHETTLCPSQVETLPFFSEKNNTQLVGEDASEDEDLD